MTHPLGNTPGTPFVRMCVTRSLSLPATQVKTATLLWHRSRSPPSSQTGLALSDVRLSSPQAWTRTPGCGILYVWEFNKRRRSRGNRWRRPVRMSGRRVDCEPGVRRFPEMRWRVQREITTSEISEKARGVRRANQPQDSDHASAHRRARSHPCNALSLGAHCQKERCIL